MLLDPFITAQFQDAPSGQFGLVDQRIEVSGDDLVSLMGVTGMRIHNLFLEPNTGSVILQPKIRHADFGTGETSRSGGLFRETLDPGTGKNVLVMYSGLADTAWRAESIAPMLLSNEGFSIDLYLAPPPKGTTKRDATSIFRRITWPSDSEFGENRYRVTLPYEEKSVIEKSTDAGTTWKRIATLDPPANAEEMRTGRNVRVTLTVMVLDGETVVWFGRDMDRSGFVDREAGGYPGGKIRVEGKGGFTTVGFGYVRFARSGWLVSPKRYGPLDMTREPSFYPYGTSAAQLAAAGQSIEARLEEAYDATHEFDYRLTLRSAPTEDDATLSASTPHIKQMTIVWPPKHYSPATFGWTDFDVHAYEEVALWDPATKVLRRENRIAMRAYGSERSPARGVEAVRVYVGYKHEKDAGGYGSAPGALRGLFVFNTEADFTSAGRDSMVTYAGSDLLWFVEPQFLTQPVFFSRWCPYALARLLFQMGGIHPSYLARLPKNSNGAACDYGPNPSGCAHPKMPVRAPFEANAPIMECLSVVQELMGAWMGTDADGFIRFEPFDPDDFETVAKAFSEAGTGDGEDYDELGGPGLGVVSRKRSVSGVKNQIVLVGIDQRTGRMFPEVFRDRGSQVDRNAPNFTAGVRAFTLASNFFVDEEFTEEALDKISKWARLPYEGIAFVANMQPFIHPLSVVSVAEARSTGTSPVEYLVTAIRTRFEGPGRALSTISGIWNGRGAAPGTEPFEDFVYGESPMESPYRVK